MNSDPTKPMIARVIPDSASHPYTVRTRAGR